VDLQPARSLVIPVEGVPLEARLQVYPSAALPGEGLTIRFEVLAAECWIVHAENRLLP